MKYPRFIAIGALVLGAACTETSYVPGGNLGISPDEFLGKSRHSPSEAAIDITPKVNHYTPPEQSGLVAIRPYPNDNDVCQVLGQNAATKGLQRDGKILIGCPKHEKGAIADRRSRNDATIVGATTHWVILSLPKW